MQKKKSLLQMGPEIVLELYTQLPREELRAITAFGQHLGIDEIEVLISEKWPHLEGHTNYFPELSTLRHLFAQRRKILMDSNVLINYLSYRSVTPELGEVHKNIIVTHRVLRQRIYRLIKIAIKLKDQGLIRLEEPNPNKESTHFKAAKKLAKRLIPLWFIDEVVLFGSVARGDFRKDSDIDICLGIIPKWISPYLGRLITWVTHQVKDDYIDSIGAKGRELFDFMRDKKILREMGFLEAGYLLAQDQIYSFTLDKGSYNFDKNTVAGYSIKRYGDYYHSVVFYPANSTCNNPGYQAVLIIDINAIMLFSVTLYPRRDGYNVKEVLIDRNKKLLNKFKLDDDALKYTSSELIHAAVKRIYKGKQTYNWQGH